MKTNICANIVPDLSRRSSQPELMDDYGSDILQLQRTLHHFKTINRWLSRERYFARNMLYAYINAHSPSALHVLDIGGGSGDFCIWVSRICRARGIDPHVYAIDSDPRVIEYAQKNCRGSEGVTIIPEDARNLAAIDIPADFIFANHFLHHIPDESIPAMLVAMYSKARHGMLINDLKRSYGAYYGYALLAGSLFRNSFAFTDGLISIRKGFLRSELDHHIAMAGLTGRLQVSYASPSRVVIRG